MKKILLSLSLAAAAVLAAAQDYTDALLLSESNYYGTARSVAMGNAFTALGGDLGSIGINPAGSAVNNYSQFTFSPGISISGISSNYNPAPAAGDAGKTTGNSWARATMPNIGFTINVSTRNRSGLKNYTMGFIANSTNYYTSDLRASGVNNTSSYMGYLAAMANDSGLSDEALGGDPLGDVSLWPAQIGFINYIVNSNGTDYVGIAQENTRDIMGNYPVVTGANLAQSFNRVRKGHKHDYVFNLGFNFSDMFFIGANLGMVSTRIDQTWSFSEEFPAGRTIEIDNVSYTFKEMQMTQWSVIDASGFYAKIGVIAVPVPGLRIGAAIQTPTATVIKEEWNVYGDAWFTGMKKHADGSESSNIYQYRLTSPFRANFGLAYTLPGLGLLSADYELVDYSDMRFKEMRGGEGSFTYANQRSRAFTGVQHNLRIGAEARLGQLVSLRAGYNLKTSPEYARYDANGNYMDPYSYDGTQVLASKEALKAFTHAVSAGIGYNSTGSFFCDLALRGTFFPDEYIYPYPTYGAGIDSPEILSRSRMWDIILTLGWRF